jgi:alkanesulfonate monooxygenase SsuD/methylene tetrahydromethanopterin reductase-like flavin-dependent oxidoreductase (luciferase family)
VPPELCDSTVASGSLNAVLNQFQLADELGFDWISISEHHYAPRLMTPNPVVLAAAASQRTKHVKIALLGPLVPLVNPVRVAEEIAMLDAIDGGRTVALFLRGTPNEHLTYAADASRPEHTRAVTQEGVRLILKAWTEPHPFAWKGEHFQFERVAVWPRCLQEPHPPVFYSGNSFESIEFAAAHRLNLAIGFSPVGVVAEHIRHYKARAREAGWQPTEDNVLYRARILVAEDDEQARAIMGRPPVSAPPVSRRPPVASAAEANGRTEPAARPPHDLAAGQGGGNPGVGGFQFYGHPRTILHQIREFHEAGVGILDIAFAPDAYGRGGTYKAMEAFASVLPEVQRMSRRADEVRS